MKVSLLLLPLLLAAVDCDDTRVAGQRGRSVTLPCRYDHQANGDTPVCWGRGRVPKSGCSDQILATDGAAVLEESRVSYRFELLGRLDQGDVSLTIHNVTEEDAGVYGCRVQVPGLFNDEKHNVNLTVFRVSECEDGELVAFTGQDVTLSCEYDRGTLGDTPVCWNKGEIPNSGCSPELVATDGAAVLEDSRASSKYQLLGRLDRGDVSLTIYNVTEEDAGRYGCRVKVRGLFNDQKHYVDLAVVKAPHQTIGQQQQQSGRLSCRNSRGRK